jgi:hypothetical protein
MRLMSCFRRAGRKPWRRSSRVVVCHISLPSDHTLTIVTDVNDDADHTYLMFSATFPKSARRLAKEYMADDVVKIKVG